jgi:Transglycosylase SLT domain/Putative peptidoglycan binding domain/LysM domain
VARVSALLAVFAIAAIACAEASAIGKVQVPGVQVALYRHGYYKGPIDGVSGPMTRGAIRKFQKDKRLHPDGVVGKQTRAAFGKFGGHLFGSRMLRRGMVGFDVSVLQFLLAERGFPPKLLNSNFGGGTERLVRKFQRRVRLPVDGIVGRRTRAALITGRVPKAKRSRVERHHPKPARQGHRHIVRPGETLTAIAARTGTTVAALARRNRLDPQRFLLVGTPLSLPAARARASASHHDVVASLNRWAAYYGVSADLVRALAWQESGFQNHVRSRIGAAGVMQVIPATWFFTERFLIGTPVPKTADGNVKIGVAYLRHLLQEFHGDVRLAVGAYYRGPAAVHRHGLGPETRHFVANVLALRGRV